MHAVYKFKILLVVSSFALATPVKAQDMILNGSFENNNAMSSMSITNLSNVDFNNLVNAATAFGSSQEIDLIRTNDGFGMISQDGTWHLGLHTRTNELANVDAFSFDLTAPVVRGEHYNLTFWAAANTAAFGGITSPVEIGISSVPDSFGTLVYATGLLSPNIWTQYVAGFIAPAGGQFLTVRNSVRTFAAEPSTWAYVDNFQLVPIPAPGVIGAFGFLGIACCRRSRTG